MHHQFSWKPLYSMSRWSWHMSALFDEIDHIKCGPEFFPQMIFCQILISVYEDDQLVPIFTPLDELLN